jgi:hypothetical protein
LRGPAATVLGQIAPEDDQVAAALRTAALDHDAEVRRRAGEALDSLRVPVGLLVGA